MKPEFSNQSCKAVCAGAVLLLHPERVAYWPSKRTLLIADVHLGKEHVFARAGNPIPAGPSEADIDRIAKLLESSAAERLLILGDLIHARPNPSEPWLERLTHFLDSHASVQVDVVAGNHDKQAGQALLDDRIRWYATPQFEAPFVFQHEPGENAQGHVLCGHIHPCYSLRASRKDHVRAPAFWFGKHYSVLPSFGQFTGGYTVKPAKRDQVFMIGPNCVLPVYGQKKVSEDTL